MCHPTSYPEVPEEEFLPYTDAITNLLLEPSNKLIVLMVGVSGSGKTFLRNYLLSQIPSTLNLTPKTLCLDDYRERLNRGKYPKGDAQHKVINKNAIPEFEKDLAACREPLIFLDNMHLRWSPDWETAVNKAVNEGYHLLPLTPPINEFMFCTSRSEHGVEDRLFFQLAAQWGGHKFSPFMYRIISPEALKDMKPLRKDRFVKLKLHRWDDGWLYIQDQYLGYIDRDMVFAVLHAGEEMRKAGLEEYFMRKDGNIHITLISPGVLQEKQLIKLAQTITHMYPQPPKTVYTGVGTLEDISQDSKTYFLTTDNASQLEWEKIIASSSTKALGEPAKLQPDGVHVTIGFRNRDIWRQNKRISPIFPFTNPSATFPPHVLLPRFRGLLESPLPLDGEGSSREGTPATIPLPMPSNVGKVFRQQVSRWLDGRRINISKIPPVQLAIFDYLITHRNVNSRLRECPNGYYLVGFVVHSGRRYLSDDDAYKKNPRLQVLVPRGLCHGFQLDKDGTLNWLGAIYPTSKFFGDNDTDEGVDLVGEDELRAETGGTDVKFILTEKANGEMFTFTVLDKIPTHEGDKYVIVCGSKNNKFLFQMILDGPRKTTLAELGQMLLSYLTPSERSQFPTQYQKSRSWTYTRVWLEMSEVFLTRLLDNPNAVWLCDMLYNTRQTACAEFESYLHPHIIAFPDGHQYHRIFALTTYQDDGTPLQTESTVRFKQLLELKEKGFGTVAINDTATTDVLDLRHDIWHRTNSEGVVLLVVMDGKIDKMIKMKTIWYVVHRGFRENLKRHVVSKSNENLAISTIRPGLQKKLREKLAIFGLRKDESGYWNDYLESLAEFIVGAPELWGKDKLAEIFQYDYPRIIAEAEAVMDKHPKRKMKDEMGTYTIARSKRTPSPVG